MANVRNLRKAAASLFDVSKRALKFLRDNPAGPTAEREELLHAIRVAIDIADPPSFDEDLASVLLTMTPATYYALVAALRARPGDKDAWSAVIEGTHETKQRVYVRLDLNHVVLQKLHFTLLHTAPQAQAKAFKRLAADVERGLERNPLEILGRCAL